MADPDWAENSGIFKRKLQQITAAWVHFPSVWPNFQESQRLETLDEAKGWAAAGKAALQTQILSATGATEPSRVQPARPFSGYSSASTPQAGCQQSACYHFPPLHICVPF